jgi:hypothetical protein
MTPSDVSRRYSNGRDLDVVLRKGYRKSGMCAVNIASYYLSAKLWMVERGRGRGEGVNRSGMSGNDAHSPERKSPRVSLCEATHCSRARALQTRFEAAAVSCDGLRSGYTEMISCNRVVMTPGDRHKK